jgi:hypothetical protein
MGRRGEQQIVNLQSRLVGLHRAPRDRTRTGKQHVKRERLRQVVVRSGIEPANHVAHRIARRQHQYRRVSAGRSDAPHQFDSVHSRQHHVEENGVEVARLRRVNSLHPVDRQSDRVVLLFQALA